jgi:L-iditol 2-dehydrogenase
MAHLCRDQRFAGHGTTDGGLRTLMAWPRDCLAPLPDSIDDVAAALLEPLGVALHAVDLGKVAPGMSAGVFGCGPIGLLIIQVLRLLGVPNVLATDPLPARRAAASALGASEIRHPDATMDGSHATAGPNWPALDVVFEVAGADGAVRDAITAVRPGGRVVMVGIPNSDRTTFRASTARRKELTLLFCRRMRAPDLLRAIDLADRGQINLGSLVTERFPIDRAKDAFEALARHDGIKLVVQPTN